MPSGATPGDDAAPSQSAPAPSSLKSTAVSSSPSPSSPSLQQGAPSSPAPSSPTLQGATSPSPEPEPNNFNFTLEGMEKVEGVPVCKFNEKNGIVVNAFQISIMEMLGLFEKEFLMDVWACDFPEAVCLPPGDECARPPGGRRSRRALVATADTAAVHYRIKFPSQTALESANASKQANPWPGWRCNYDYEKGTCAGCTEGRVNAVSAKVSKKNGACQSCARGRSATGPNTPCMLCPPGKVQPLEEALEYSSCAFCPLGKAYHPANATRPFAACLGCGKGTFQPYNDRGVDAQCLSCPAGWSSKSCGTRDTCSRCTMGKFAPRNHSASCFLCATSMVAGAMECKGCDPGEFSQQSQSSSESKCSACPEGFYADAYGASSCRSCKPGTYTERNGSVACERCLAGTHGMGDENGPAGMWQPATSKDNACKLCGKGKYGEREGRKSEAVACFQCPSGFFSEHEGSTSCQKCPRGYFQELHEAFTCKACPSGRVFGAFLLPGQKNRSVCELCPIGYAGVPEAVGSSRSRRCMACPEDRTTGKDDGSAASRRCRCQKDLNYETNATATLLPPSWGECARCPPGANCSLEDGMLLTDIWPKGGYWRRTADSSKFISCVGPYSTSEKATENAKKRCSMTMATATANASTLANISSLSSLGQWQDRQCTANYTGIICALCVDGFVQGADGMCQKCAPPNVGAAVGLFVIFMAILAVGVIVGVYGIGKNGEKCAHDELSRSKHLIKLSWDYVAVHITIVSEF